MDLALENLGAQLRADDEVALDLAHPAINRVAVTVGDIEVGDGSEAERGADKRGGELQRAGAVAHGGRDDLLEHVEHIGHRLKRRRKLQFWRAEFREHVAR